MLAGVATWRGVTELAQTLVGRETELDLLERMLEEGCAGSPQIVFVTGEPGIGKSSLLAELLRRAEERGCLALRGSAAEFERDLPFGLIIDALDEYLESLGPQRVPQPGDGDPGRARRSVPGAAVARPGLG